MSLKTLLAAAFLLLACGSAALAQDSFPWDKYQARTFAEVARANTDEVNSQPALSDKVVSVFAGDPLYSQVRVTYTSTTRKLPPARKAHLEEWGKTFRVRPEVVALYESELLVTECGSEHWVPVQKQVLRHFEKELKKGDMVTLFTMFAGGRKIEGSWHWLFIVNEFQAYR